MKRKIIRKLMISTLTAGSLLTGVSAASGILLPSITLAAESPIPRLVSVTANKTAAKPSDTIRLTAEPTPDSDVNGVQLTVVSKSDPDFTGRVVNMTKQSDGSLSGELTIDDSWPNGDTYIDNVYVGDYAGGSGTYYTHYDSAADTDAHNRDISEITYVGFNVNSSTGDTQGPVINSVTFDKTEAKPGDTLTLTLNVTDQSKIDNGSINNSFIYRKDASTDYSFADITLGDWSALDDNGNMSATIKIDDTWKNGSYDVYMIGISDEYSNSTHIGGATELEKLFDGFTVSDSKELSSDTSEDTTGQSTDSQDAEPSNNPGDDTKGDSIYPPYYGSYLNMYNAYAGQPFVVEDEKGNNNTDDTKIELYKKVDGKEIKVEKFGLADYIINYYPQSESFPELYISEFNHYRLLYESDYSDISGDYILRCVDVPDGYEKFSDIAFSISVNKTDAIMKNIIKLADKDSTTVKIPNKNPDYINEKGWVTAVSPKDPTRLEQVKTDQSKLGKMAEENKITDIYDLFTIVLQKKQTTNTNGKISSSASGKNGAATAVRTSGSNVTKAAPTGDSISSAPWIIAGSATIAAAGTIIAVRRKKISR